MIKVTFTAVNSGIHGIPGTLLERVYKNEDSLSHLPLVGEVVMIQYGDNPAQMSSFTVKTIHKSFWKDCDHLQFWVESAQ